MLLFWIKGVWQLIKHPINKTNRVAIYLLKLDRQVDSFISSRETFLNNNRFLEKDFTFFQELVEKLSQKGNFYTYWTWVNSYIYRVSNQLMRVTLNQLSKIFICQYIQLLKFSISFDTEISKNQIWYLKKFPSQKVFVFGCIKNLCI